MRNILIAIPLLLCAAPGLAQPAPQFPPELTDPATADKLANAMQGISQALLDIRIGEARAALEGREASPAEKRMTVRDMARREDPDFERKYREQIASVRPAMRQSMTALSKALPAMLEGLGQAQQALERAFANMPDPTYPRR